MIIGLGHRARRGKDTVAMYLNHRYKFVHVSFAAALKEAAKHLFTLSDEQVNGEKKDQIDDFWKMTPRELFQRFGSDCMRLHFDEDVWVKILERKLRQWGVFDPGGGKGTVGNVVISDVRFENEAAAIKRLGGQLWRIDRDMPQVTGGLHVSETALANYSGWDEVLDNNSTIQALCRQVDAFLAKGSINVVKT